MVICPVRAQQKVVFLFQEKKNLFQECFSWNKKFRTRENSEKKFLSKKISKKIFLKIRKYIFLFLEKYILFQEILNS